MARVGVRVTPKRGAQPGGRLVLAMETKPNPPDAPLTIPDYLDWKEKNHSFEQFEACSFAGFNLTGSDQPVRLADALVTPGCFRMLGVSPQLGRDFRPDEGLPGGKSCSTEQPTRRRRAARGLPVVPAAQGGDLGDLSDEQDRPA